MLNKSFFNRSALEVAPDLLGKHLVKEDGGRKTIKKITETEAYCGIKDKACHASSGKTDRNEVMFGTPGVWYVYLIYGIYDMLNVVTGPEKNPSAVLIRGVEGIDGPGKLTRDLGIGRKFNKKKLSFSTGLWIEDRGNNPKKIKKLKRVGVDYAGKWAEKKWRFKI